MIWYYNLGQLMTILPAALLRLYIQFTKLDISFYCSFSWVGNLADRPRNLVPQPPGDATGFVANYWVKD